ncbi:MAG: aspartate-semialdehyde dehydrogenase [Planctomycetota bacterium]
MKKLRFAIAGATGAVGTEILRLLEARSLPVETVRPLASERSVGASVRFRGEDVPVSVLGRDSFDGVDVALFSCGASLSREYAPAAVGAGAVVVDNSSAFRVDPAVPLVVPEINADALEGHRGIVANPNCTTIVTLMAVAPLAAVAGISSMRVASYQAASGAGARAMAELTSQTADVLAGREATPVEFDQPIAFNVIPAIGSFRDDGTTTEERKLTDESRRILGRPDLRVSAVCVRVPVLRAHCAAVWLETERPLTPERAREVLAAAPGVKVVDEPARLAYPMPISAAGRSEVEVGRIRADESDSGPGSGMGLTFFVAGDQLLKGAALNAVQIAERLFS